MGRHEGRALKALLDTHVLLWWLEQNPRLSPRQKEILADARLGRVELDLPLRDWLERAVAPPLVQLVSITPAIAAEVASLPDSFHRDPADRILVASARTLGAALLTQDRRIIDSGLIPTIP